MKTGVIVGGTGAQGAVVVNHLSSLGLYHLKVLTRNVESSQAQHLASLPNVELIQSSPLGHDEESFLFAVKDADFAFINTDGFSIGEVAETYWGIRFFELAHQAGVKHYVYSSLDSIDQDVFRIGHYGGKSRVVDYMRGQTPSNRPHTMVWSAISTGPYIETLHENLAPRLSHDGSTYLFTYPLGSGALAFTHLDDFARYVEKIVSDPPSYASNELKVATAHVTGDDIAQAFTRVTGKAAQFVDIPIDTWLDAAFGHHTRGIDTPVGLQIYPHLAGSAEKLFLPLTFRENFTGFWKLWRYSRGNAGPGIVRDYAKLDAILPNRVRTVEEWMRKVDYTGEKKPVLKMLNNKLGQGEEQAAEK
ncbi:hypothetical protein OHC33_004446 [Knufia fluminis]|uniref:NmrA-like domain-containing protein n=1 Tax=Knufia fluminis TaxID=191047 RepID=A0AAN8I4Y7_9EURO|nr:hypothetical protein OHC33_004446 [Knufia fluminis]